MESANVVGYQGIPVKTDLYNFMVSTFDKVDGSTMKLGDISVDENYSVSTISFLKPDTAATKTFEIEVEGEKKNVFGFMYWFEGDLVETPFEGKPGWYYADEDTGALFDMNNVEIPYGSMFYVEGAEDCNIVVSGNVLKGDQPVAVVTDLYNFMGNCTPTDLKLADIGVDEETYSVSTLSFLKPDTAATKTFEIEVEGVKKNVFGFMYWFEGDLVETAFEGKPGWYYADEDTGALFDMNGVDIPAGSMFYIEGAEDTSIIIPSAL